METNVGSGSWPFDEDLGGDRLHPPAMQAAD